MALYLCGLLPKTLHPVFIPWGAFYRVSSKYSSKLTSSSKTRSPRNCHQQPGSLKRHDNWRQCVWCAGRYPGSRGKSEQSVGSSEWCIHAGSLLVTHVQHQGRRSVIGEMGYGEYRNSSYFLCDKSVNLKLFLKWKAFFFFSQGSAKEKNDFIALGESCHLSSPGWFIQRADTLRPSWYV